MITKRSPLFLGIFLLLSISSFGQKIKYKDLFVLLNAKQFDQAEPFLKKYLVDNMDNPNALLFMAYILEEKALADDVLTELEKVKNHSDSGTLYFDLAYKGIDEKELRKNDEYYQMYSRRDLRTGKFGIKLSDVQVDIEKRMKYLKDREQRVIELHEKFNATKKIYLNIEVLFKMITSRYKDRTEFLLRSDESLKTELRNLSRKYDSLLISFNDYTTHLASLGKTGHNQEFDVQQIDGFKHDGYVEPDFIQDEIKIWDYKRWALVNLDIIENEIDPSRASLVKIDAELNDLREKLRKDSVEVSAEAKEIYQKASRLSIKKYDPRPMPLDVLGLKVKELNYGSNLAKTSTLRDSADVKLQRDLLTRDIAFLAGIDSAVMVLNNRDLEIDFENYKGFVKDAYGSASVLKSLIKTTGDFATAEKNAKEKQVERLLESINWIIDGADSIPVTSAVKSSTYFPVVTVEDKYTFGLKLGDSLKNYFYTITPSRRPDIKVKLPADTLFKKENQGKIKGLSTVTNNKNYIAVLYSEQKIEEKISGFVYQVAANGLVWSTNILMEGIPSEITYIEEGKNILIKTATADSGFKTLILDSKGKVIAYN